MKNVLFATTAASALLIGGIASAQGIALFGDARLGLGYNINNDGGLILDDNGNAGRRPPRRLPRPVRRQHDRRDRQRHHLRRHDPRRQRRRRQGRRTNGQTEGSVFVSGSWGTLTIGDTNGADEQWVGDVPGDYSLTGLGNFDETPFVSNGGGFGSSDSINFANNPNARPTIRYDFDIMGFGISLSSNRDLTDIVVGTGYSVDFGGGSFSIGVGYNNFESFEFIDQSGTATLPFDLNGNGTIDPGDEIVVPAVTTTSAPDGEQWSVGLKGTYEPVRLRRDLGQDRPRRPQRRRRSTAAALPDACCSAPRSASTPSRSAPTTRKSSTPTVLAEGRDGDKAYGLTGQYDLGGGATVNGGIASVDGVERPRRRRYRDRRRLRYLDGVLIPNNGTVRGERRASARLFL